MPNSLSDIEQLQREAAELRAERKSLRSDPPPKEPPQQGEKPEWEASLDELSALLEGAAEDIEQAAREHPALALLAAFAAGIVIGQLLSRR